MKFVRVQERNIETETVAYINNVTVAYFGVDFCS